MNKTARNTTLAACVSLLGACVSVPTGPSVMTLPGTGKSFDQFRVDDAACRQFAYTQIGGKTAGQASSESFAGSAAVGTVLGAAAGAAVNGNQGAGVGAATGLLMGSAAGVNQANASADEVQRRYDNYYIQCMYASGHRVPVYGNFRMEQRPAYSPPPAPATYPPPPPGYKP
jgi:hypothetical protein